jgi:hypothetical protein
MRSGWSPEATYVTFKAGDNYWSHSHLDQGAFTVDKLRPLAIDSGIYAEAGSDHHMNYAYQTVAHNTVTVTDPRDTVPAPGKDRPRAIANDGGQRRVGSGWGVEAGPLDRREWDAKRDIYHTGRIERLFEQDGITVAIADVTPAYTNRLSGRGTFSHRTRRVERFWRTLAYDRADDVIVVFDQVVATEAGFRKRWLLHSVQAPRVTAEGFELAGGLTAKVLLPRDALIHPLGGAGFEFFVDQQNYPEKATRAEAGAWRVEVIPAASRTEDHFLVVLMPGSQPVHRVRLLQAGNAIGCEVRGPKRTSRWWFEPGRNGVRMEVGAVVQNLIQD